MRDISGKTVADVLYGLVVGLAAGTVATLGPILAGFLALWIFNRLGWMRASKVAAGFLSFHLFFIVFGVAVGLTVCLRVWGRRLGKHPDSEDRE